MRDLGVAGDAGGLEHRLLVASQVQPVQTVQDGRVAASVLRSRSVSSMRSRNSPP